MKRYVIALLLCGFYAVSCARKTPDNLSLADQNCAHHGNGPDAKEQLVSCLRSLPHENIRNIPEVKSYLDQHPVYISLTSSPERLQKLTFALETIDLDLVTNIFIVLPKLFKNKEAYSDADIEALKKFPKVEVLQVDDDLGPITKMLPAIEHARKIDSKAIVISIDDDIAYSIGTFGQVVKTLILNPHAGAVGTMGNVAATWQLRKPVFTQECYDNGVCDVLEGFGSIGYNVGLIPTEKLRGLSQTSRVCRLGDDVVINYGLALSGVERRKVSNEYVAGMIGLEYGFGADALHKQNNYKESYQQCVIDIDMAGN